MKTSVIFGMKITHSIYLILQYYLISTCGEKPEINLSVMLPNGKGMPWSLLLTEKAVEMGEDKLKEILKGHATVNILRTISEGLGCSKYDYGALGAKVRYVMNVSAFVGPGKYSFLLSCHFLN